MSVHPQFSDVGGRHDDVLAARSLDPLDLWFLYHEVDRYNPRLPLHLRRDPRRLG